MSRVMKATLSTKSIDSLIKELKSYKAGLQTKCHEFVVRLAECGISAAYVSVGEEFGKYITFRSVDTFFNGRAVAIIEGSSPSLWRFWLGEDGRVKSAEINPLLIEEFGSGSKASDASGKENAEIAKKLGMGRGSFPDQTHAFQDEWWWKDLDGEWHSSSGTEPSMPMFKASLEMRVHIKRIAREVFGS